MGRVGGWMKWVYTQLSPILKLEQGLGLSLAIFYLKSKCRIAYLFHIIYYSSHFHYPASQLSPQEREG